MPSSPPATPGFQKQKHSEVFLGLAEALDLAWSPASHFTDEETEAQPGTKARPAHASRRMERSHPAVPGLLAGDGSDQCLVESCQAD
jgi:hypothetical protein